jgi:AraC-like DNA-binding protein
LLFYTVQLITLKRTNPARRYLGLMLLSMTAFLVVNAVYHLGYIGAMEWLYYLFVPILLTLLPVFYLYIVALARGNRDIDGRTRLLLFLPPIVIFMLNLIAYRAIPHEQKLIFLQNGFQFSKDYIPAVDNAAILHWAGIAGLLLIQLVLAVTGGYKLIKREAEQMHLQPQHLAYLKLDWIFIVSVCVLIFLVGGALLNMFGPARDLLPAFIFNVLILISGGLIGYFGMKQDALLDQVYKVKSVAPAMGIDAENVMHEEDSDVATESGAPSRFQGFITESEAAEIIKDLDTLMRKGKPYLNPKFSLYDLCNLMNVSRRKMTYIINEVMQKNFYGVINDYRIEESIRLLENRPGTDYKMDSIAEMVGFNSKSSFYACFKKYNGVTPTEYRMGKNLKGK